MLLFRPELYHIIIYTVYNGYKVEIAIIIEMSTTNLLRKSPYSLLECERALFLRETKSVNLFEETLDLQQALLQLFRMWAGGIH